MGRDRFPELKKIFTYSMEVSIEPKGGRRCSTPIVTFKKYKGNFEEVTHSYSKEQAKLEATRCLRCDVKEEVEEEL
jgi:NADH-quinone oxidoreductase subunit F